MKRILLVLNANQPDVSSVDFACRLADLNDSRVFGVLVENMLGERSHAQAAHVSSGQTSHANTQVSFLDPVASGKLFKDTCQCNGLEADVEVVDGGALPYVVRQSHFADLLVMSPGSVFSTDGGDLPATFTRDLLRSSACPVLLAPRHFVGIDETIFCFDGSPSSLFALKTYTCLFPGLTKETMTILEVGRSEDAVPDEAHRNLVKWARCHYKNVRLQTLAGDPEEELLKFLYLKTGKMVILGAYGRPKISNFFRRSIAEKLIRNIDLPMFISHL